MQKTQANRLYFNKAELIWLGLYKANTLATFIFLFIMPYSYSGLGFSITD